MGSNVARCAQFGAALWVVCAACHGSGALPPDAPPKPATNAPKPSEAQIDWIYNSAEGGLKPGWQDLGSAKREVGPGPVKLHLVDATSEWAIAKPELGATSGSLVFRIKEPLGEGEFLQVRVDAPSRSPRRPIKLSPERWVDLDDGWRQVSVPFDVLNPDGIPFDRFVFSEFRPIAADVLIDQVGMTAGAIKPPSTYSEQTARPATMRIACDVKATKISPYIYGMGGVDDKLVWAKLGATAHRWGGNGTSRYNWETHFGNLTSDWFFENKPNVHYTQFLAEDAEHQAASALTVPIIGWVAKDGTSFSFPVSTFGPQAKTDPSNPEAGNGVTRSGENIKPGPQTRTSIPAPPEWVKRWVQEIRAEDAKTGKRSVYEYILDNEPMLWSSTHRDVRPDALGYDEFLDRTIRYGTAIREADPDALIAGPAEWGWPNYFFSAIDTSTSFGRRPDRNAHGAVPLIEWYLRKLREYEQKTGVRVLDVVDMHYYPQNENVYGGGTGGSDRHTALVRIRSTRSLWDPSYMDESWVRDNVRLLPRMHEWIDQNYPGRGISIGEWNFGGEKDISGALATAEVLGRFAQFGVTSAFYWTIPPEGSPTGQAFLAYRNFDGRGGRFLDWYLPTTVPADTSLFASRDEAGGHIVAVALNLSPDSAFLASIDTSSCGAIADRRAYVYTRTQSTFLAEPTLAGSPATEVRQVLPPWSLTVLDLHMTRP